MSTRVHSLILEAGGHRPPTFFHLHRPPGHEGREQVWWSATARESVHPLLFLHLEHSVYGEVLFETYECKLKFVYESAGNKLARVVASLGGAGGAERTG